VTAPVATASVDEELEESYFPASSREMARELYLF